MEGKGNQENSNQNQKKNKKNKKQTKTKTKNIRINITRRHPCGSNSTLRGLLVEVLFVQQDSPHHNVHNNGKTPTIPQKSQAPILRETT